MAIKQDIARVARQEERLRFPGFDANTAWTVGTRLRELAASRKLSVAIDIQVNGHQLFFTAMPGTTPDNIDWIRRKRNVVQHFHRSSYAISLELRQQKTTLAEKIGVNDRDYAPHGGCFPIKLKGTGCIGTITVSGLPQRADHELIIEVLAELLEQPLKELALETQPDKSKGSVLICAFIFICFVHPVDAFGGFIGGNLGVSGYADYAERMGDIRIGRQNGQGIATRAGLEKFGLDFVVVSPTFKGDLDGNLSDLPLRFKVTGDKSANQIDKSSGSPANSGANQGGGKVQSGDIGYFLSQDIGHGIPLWLGCCFAGILGASAVYAIFFLGWFAFNLFRKMFTPK